MTRSNWENCDGTIFNSYEDINRFVVEICKLYEIDICYPSFGYVLLQPHLLIYLSQVYILINYLFFSLIIPRYDI